MKRIILPEEKLNALAEELSQKLFESRYFTNGVIKGDELKTCTEFSQVNKFLLFQLFQVLNQQIQRLKHPNFDFEQPEIQATITQLQNQLSRHIKISQEDFKPILKKAVYNNLKLVLDPIDTLGNFFFHNQDKVSLETYEKYAPFFSDFDFAVNSILRYHQKNGMKVVEKDIFFVKLHRVIAIFNSSGEKDIEAYRSDVIQRLTGKSIYELVNEAQKEAEEKRKIYHQKEAEIKAQEEAEKTRAEAEARAKAEAEERKRAEEEARLKAEEEAKRKEAEEKRLREMSIFETIQQPNTYFEIADDGGDVPVNEEVIAIEDVPTGRDADALSSNENAFSATPITSGGVTFFDDEEDVITTAPEVKIPSIELPSVEVPNIEVPSIEVPNIEVPSVEVPNIEVPSVEVPNIEVPSIEVPSVEVPNIEVPNIEVPSIEVPSIEVPSVEVPSIEVPSMEVPNIEVPNIEVPSVEVPSIEVPSVEVPNFEVPSVEVPSVEVPNIEVTSIEVPSVEVPNIEVPSIEVPSIEVPKDENVMSVFEKFFGKKTVTPPIELPKEEEDTIIGSTADLNTETTILSTILPIQEEPKTIASSFISDAPQHLINTFNAERKIKLEDIPIHKQYMYVQRVFTGNNVRFRIIIDKVNEANDRQAIEEIVDKYILSNPDIRPQDPVVEEFIGLLRNRFIG